MHLFPFNYDGYTNATSKVFPRMCKCDYVNYGGSGSLQRYDALCLLPLNIVNEKIFTFLYFWLVLLITIAGIDLLHSVFIAFRRNYRVQMIANKALCTFTVALNATDEGSLGDFFMLYMMCKNMPCTAFCELVAELSAVREKLLCIGRGA